MEKDPKIFLEHILESIDLIFVYVAGLDFDKFLNLKETQDAIVRRLEIIGEAARNLSKDFKDKYAEINWKEVIGMRDKIVHEYFDIDLKIVWDTTKDDLPNFKKQIDNLLKKL